MVRVMKACMGDFGMLDKGEGMNCGVVVVMKCICLRRIGNMKSRERIR